MKGFLFSAWVYACGVIVAAANVADSDVCHRSPSICAVVTLAYPAAVTAGALAFALDELFQWEAP